MKTSIFVINTEGKIFEFDNTLKCSLNIANEFNHSMYPNINDFDVIFFTDVNFMRGETMTVVHKSKSKEESIYIIKAIFKKLKEKSDLLHQIQVLKKIKDLDEKLIENMKKNIRNNYFQIKIEDILKDFNKI